MKNHAQTNATIPTHSCWVVASAGTGKTKILIDRIIRLLLDGTEPDRIVCMTYTKAAAFEMSERLLQKLEAWSCCDDITLKNDIAHLQGEDSKTSTHPHEIIDHARSLFRKVFESPPKIQTIHSFCQSVLLKNSFVVNLLPNFTILNEFEKDELIEDILQNILKKESFAHEFHVLGSFISESHLKECLKECLDNRLKITKSPDFTTWLASIPTTPVFNHAEIRSATHEIAQSGPKNIQQKAQFCLEYSNETSLEYEELLFDLFLTTEGLPRKALQEKYGKIQDAVLQLKTARDMANLIALHAAFNTLLQEFLKAYAHAKNQRNTLDFDDVLDKTHVLLKDHHDGNFLRLLDASFDHLMVDEAQDTSPLQWQILFQLLNHFFDSLANNQNPRTVFVVGDFKQSIYSFQGADPQEYNKAKSYIQELLALSGFNLLTIDLATCYRSTPEILELVDNVLSQDLLKSSIQNPSLHTPHRTEDRGHVELWPLLEEIPPEPIIPWHLPPYPTASTSSEETLAFHIAKKVQNFLISEVLLPSTQKPIRPQDIFILVKRRTGLLSHIDKALKKHHIPCSGLDRITLTDHLFIKDIMACLQFIDLPQDNLNLASLLKSPLFGFSENDLIRLSLALNESMKDSENLSLLDVLQHDSLSKDASILLQKIQEIAKTSSLHALIHNLVHTFLPRATAIFGPLVNDLNQALLSITLQYQSSHSPTLAGFLEHLQTQGQKLALPSQEKGVTLMTIHGAKGLQAPVVIIADMGDDAITTHSSVIFKDGSYLLRSSNSLLDFIKSDEKKKLTEENHRLLYVALTRAQDHLIMCGINRQAKDCWHSLVSPFIREHAPDFTTHDNKLLSALLLEQDSIIPPLPLINERISPQNTTSTAESKRGVALHKLFEIMAKNSSLTPDILNHSTFALLTHEDYEKVQTLNQKLSLSTGYSELSLTTKEGKTLRLDHVHIGPDTVTILDYKSSQAQKIQHHEQMNVYIQALRDIFPHHTISAKLVYIETGTIIDASPTAVNTLRPLKQA